MDLWEIFLSGKQKQFFLFFCFTRNKASLYKVPESGNLLSIRTVF